MLPNLKAYAATLGVDLDKPEENLQPEFDPKQFKDVLDDALHGRKIADYVKVLTKAGFKYNPPAKLAPWSDGRPKVEGEWRFKWRDVRLALTENMICSWFETPAEFWFWFRKQIIRARAGMREAQ